MDSAEKRLTAEVMDDVLDYRMLNNLFEFQRKNNPALKDKSLADIADDCETCETTIKGMLKGRNRNPRLATAVRFIKAIGGGSIDRLVGLAPPRDFMIEEAAYDKTLVETLQARLDGKNERIEEYKTQVAELEAENQRVRKLYLKACEDLSARNEKCAQIDEYRTRIVRFRTALIVFAAVALICAGIIIYVTWDISTPEAGNIGAIVWR